MKSILGNKDEYRTSRIFYLIEATVEYLISLLMTGAYLAKLTSYLGISDSLTGIITAIVQLGYTFQLAALFLAGKRPVKRWVTAGHILANIFFTVVYLCPFIKIDQTLRTVLFFAFIVLGCAISNIVISSKINMYMSLVDSEVLGKFAAVKEIISLISGMVFTYLVGFVMDAYEASGNIEGSFIFCGIAVFILSFGHGLILLFSKEKKEDQVKYDTIKNLKNVFSNKDGMMIVIVFAINNIFKAPIMSYVGAYQNNDLKFSMTYVAIVAAIASIARALLSVPIADYGDKHSYKKETIFCLGLELLAFVVLMFTNPSNGKIMYPIYATLNSVSCVGLVGGGIALIYDTVGRELRTEIYALKTAIAGLAGFFATIGASFLVDYIQANGNKLFGYGVYAQQVLALLGSIGTITTAIIFSLCVKENDKRAKKEKD